MSKIKFILLTIFTNLWGKAPTIMQNLETIQVQNNSKESFRIYCFAISDRAFVEEVKNYTVDTWREKLQNDIFFSSNPNLATKPLVFSLMSGNVSRLVLIYNDRQSIVGFCVVMVTFDGSKILVSTLPNNDVDSSDIANLLLLVTSDLKLEVKRGILSKKANKLLKSKLKN